jgi:nitroreductase
VDDRALLKKLSLSKPHGAAFLAGVPIAIAVLGDTSRSDVWVEDTAIASLILLLMAEALGLGACWCQIRKRAQSEEVTADACVKALLDVPDPFSVASIIGIGYAKEARPPYDEAHLQFEKLFYNRFGQRLERLMPNR